MTLIPKSKDYKIYKKETEEEKPDISPSPKERNEDVFIEFLAADTNGTVYTDLTGEFPVTSISGHKYVIVLYHYNSNGIIFRPMKNRRNIEAMRV